MEYKPYNLLVFQRKKFFSWMKVKRKTIESFEPKNTPYQSMNEALESYKNMRADHIKYIRSTTEDIHNHITQLPFGMIDCYQICLFMAAHNNRHTQQINEIKADPGFPKQ